MALLDSCNSICKHFNQPPKQCEDQRVCVTLLTLRFQVVPLHIQPPWFNEMREQPLVCGHHASSSDRKLGFYAQCFLSMNIQKYHKCLFEVRCAYSTGENAENAEG